MDLQEDLDVLAALCDIWESEECGLPRDPVTVRELIHSSTYGTGALREVLAQKLVDAQPVELGIDTFRHWESYPSYWDGGGHVFDDGSGVWCVYYHDENDQGDHEDDEIEFFANFDDFKRRAWQQRAQNCWSALEQLNDPENSNADYEKVLKSVLSTLGDPADGCGSPPPNLLAAIVEEFGVRHVMTHQNVPDEFKVIAALSGKPS